MCFKFEIHKFQEIENPVNWFNLVKGFIVKSVTESQTIGQSSSGSIRAFPQLLFSCFISNRYVYSL